MTPIPPPPIMHFGIVMWDYSVFFPRVAHLLRTTVVVRSMNPLCTAQEISAQFTYAQYSLHPGVFPVKSNNFPFQFCCLKADFHRWHPLVCCRMMLNADKTPSVCHC